MAKGCCTLQLTSEYRQREITCNGEPNGEGRVLWYVSSVSVSLLLLIRPTREIIENRCIVYLLETGVGQVGRGLSLDLGPTTATPTALFMSTIALCQLAKREFFYR